MVTNQCIVLPLAMSDSVLINVLLEVVRADAMMYTANRILNVRPKTLNAVCVNVARDEDAIVTRR